LINAYVLSLPAHLLRAGVTDHEPALHQVSQVTPFRIVAAQRLATAAPGQADRVGNLAPRHWPALVKGGQDLHGARPQIFRPAMAACKSAEGLAAHFGQTLESGGFQLCTRLGSNPRSVALVVSIAGQTKLASGLADKAAADRQFRACQVLLDLAVGPAKAVQPTQLVGNPAFHSSLRDHQAEPPSALIDPRERSAELLGTLHPAQCPVVLANEFALLVRIGTAIHFSSPWPAWRIFCEVTAASYHVKSSSGLLAQRPSWCKASMRVAWL
jgi:hypothetical protein